MPIVQIHLIKGRSIEQKREMAQKITEIISSVAKTEKEDVEIIFSEIEKEDFSKGGTLAIDKRS